ncbi:MAG: DUF1963 domain-containing protein [Clostridia bacterium]|nr:DUF1963 domain-containing protein [Clostridia bacterium]
MGRTIDEIRDLLMKKAIVFNTGGFQPKNEMWESWIGKVAWQKADETQPLDKKGQPLIPIATIFLDGSDYVPLSIRDKKLITVYMDTAFWDNLDKDDLQEYFVIRMYDNVKELVSCNYTSSEITPFPLSAEYVINEYPQWEDIETLGEDVFDDILAVEKESGFDYYDYIFEQNNSKHKVGGWPSSIQGGVGFDDGFEYAFQISSDEKAGMNIVDNGNFYFGYNKTTNQWSVRCDFY